MNIERAEQLAKEWGMNDDLKPRVRIQLVGGPHDGKYAMCFDNETRPMVDGNEYARAPGWKTAQYIEPPAPPTELPEPQPARHTLGANDCVVLEYPGVLNMDQVERNGRAVASAFGIEPRRVLVLDDGARMSTLTKTVPLTEARIDELAKRADLTRDRAPEWFVEMVRTVEDEHGIK